ncbi:anti-sigma factor [Roseibium aestuarii]|uniref:Anti-sigma factor domain-containing protein n=1 Tax=Roseibium aestuarii TaxID=2600299 RepID=A0ABW4JUE1_9HYPH|nr:anti-sigma factor [Roseibium aestuarii]
MSDAEIRGQDREALAGEYVLGTLTAEEQARAERLMLTDAAFRKQVNDWRERFLPLDEAVPPEPVPDEIWRRIEAHVNTLDALGPQGVSNRSSGRSSGDGAGMGETARLISLEAWQRRARFWRRATVSAGALAACLAALVASAPPPFLLERLGISAPAPQRYVAVVNRDGDLPALLVNVDPVAGVVEVRSVAAETPPDKSLEVWYIEDGQPQPLSLGIVEAGLDVTRLVARSGEVLTGANPLIAITLEPLGGSPVPGPTGPLVYSGKLIPVE